MRSVLAKGAVILVLALVAGILRIGDANPAMAQTQRIGAWRVTEAPGLDGSAPEWQSILPVVLPTTNQQVTPPMGGGAVGSVAVRAVHWDENLYVMLEWVDPTPNRLSDRYEAFTDSAAIQFPAEAGSAVPFICMGQADQAVNIWHWRGDQQEEAPALGSDGYVDLYPETDDLYFPARAAGNPLSQQARSPVHNLVAGGFGTLDAVDFGTLQGNGVYSGNRWMVVYTRPFQPAGELQPAFAADQPIDVAFAMWDGNKRERDGIKSLSAFTQLRITNEGPPRRAVPATDDWPAYTPSNPASWFGLGFVLLIVALFVVVWRQVGRRGREDAART